MHGHVAQASCAEAQACRMQRLQVAQLCMLQVQDPLDSPAGHGLLLVAATALVHASGCSCCCCYSSCPDHASEAGLVFS